MGKDDLPITERRKLYNQLARRCKSDAGLPAGLVQQYTQCMGNTAKRWEMLKHFICDRDMRLWLMQCPPLSAKEGVHGRSDL